MTNISDKELEVLSAYLDGEINRKERERIESRLSQDKGLQEIYEQLRNNRAVMRSLPQLRAPRDYTLTPEMVGQVLEPRQLFPVFRLATVLATVLLILFLFGDFYLVRYPPAIARISLQSMEAGEQIQAPAVVESELYESQAPEALLPEVVEEMPVEEEVPESEPRVGAAQPAEPLAEMEKMIATGIPTLEAALSDAMEGDIQAQRETPTPTVTEVPPAQEEEGEAARAEESQPVLNYLGIVRVIEVVLILVIISTGIVTIFLYLRGK